MRATATTGVLGAAVALSMFVAPLAAQVDSAELWLMANNSTSDSYANWPDFRWVGEPSYVGGVPGEIAAFGFDGTNGLVAQDATLGNFHTGDFVIQFDILTTQSGGMAAVVAKREVCGPPPFWDVRLGDGVLFVEYDTTDAQVTLSNPTPINDGDWHTVNLTRSGTTLALAIDGAVVDTGSVAPGADVDSTAQVAVANGDPCVGVDGTVPLVGRMDNLYLGTGPMVDLSLVQPSVPVIARGGTGTVSLELRNPGSGDVGSTVAINQPDGVTFVGVDLPGCSIAPSGGVSCQSVSVPSGSTTLNIDVELSSDLAPGSTVEGIGFLVNQQRPDPNKTNDTEVPYRIQVASEAAVPVADPSVGAAAGLVALAVAALLWRRSHRMRPLRDATGSRPVPPSPTKGVTQ